MLNGDYIWLKNCTFSFLTENANINSEIKNKYLSNCLLEHNESLKIKSLETNIFIQIGFWKLFTKNFNERCWLDFIVWCLRMGPWLRKMKLRPILTRTFLVVIITLDQLLYAKYLLIKHIPKLAHAITRKCKSKSK